MPFTAAITVMAVATPEGLPLSVTLTFGIFYEMLDAWSLLGSKTFCLLHNELSHKKKKKDFALTKQALNSKWDEASKTLAW